MVVVVHSIDVSPELNFLCPNGSANKRCGIITASTFQVVDFVLMVSTDVALCNQDVGIGHGVQNWLETFADFLQLGLLVFIDRHEVKSWKEARIDFSFLAMMIKQFGGNQFTLG